MEFASVVERGNKWIELLNIDGQVVARFEKVGAELPKERPRRTLNGRKRWLDGSLMTRNQAVDEDYQTEMRIA